MDLEVAAHSVGPLTRDYLSKLPHHVLPCMNLHRGFPFEEKKDFKSDFLSKKVCWNSSIPVPLTKYAGISLEAVNGIDPTTTLIRDKIRWQKKKEKILNAVKKDKKNISDKVMRRAREAEDGTNIVVPRGVALLANHLDKDPDPHFSGAYNWYYTGGTLATLANNEESYLLYASQSKMCCSKYDNGQNSELFTLALEQNSPIYQVATNKIGAVARQKSCVSLFAICQSEDKLCLKKIHSVSDEKDPFLGVALRDKSNKKYFTLSSSGNLKLWDVEYAKGYKAKVRVAAGEGVHVMDSWCSIQFVDSRTLLLADRCCIHLLDCRVNMNEKQLAWCPRKLGEHCEQLTYVTRSHMQDQVVYCTTTHQALTLDLRVGFGQRWSHMMSAPPYLGFTHTIKNNQELLCIGSQVMSDCVAMVNSWRGNNPEAEFRPVVLPSPFQGLMLARQQGLCLEPTLSQRFCQSMVGLTWLPAADGLHVVRQSASGDVFIQELANTDAAEPSNQLTHQQRTAYFDWSNAAMSLQRDPNTVSVTDVKDFTSVLEALTDTYPTEEPRSDEGERRGGWRRSKQYMEDCMDLLAGRLLAVWEVEDEDEWLQEEDETLAEQDAAEKVHNWLNDFTLPGTTTLMKPKVTSTPHVRPTSLARSPNEPSQWMAVPEQTLPVAPTTPTSPPLSLPSSGSITPSSKRRKLLEVTSNSKQQTPASKPSTNTAKKKFIPGF